MVVAAAEAAVGLARFADETTKGDLSASARPDNVGNNVEPEKKGKKWNMRN